LAKLGLRVTPEFSAWRDVGVGAEVDFMVAVLEVNEGVKPVTAAGEASASRRMEASIFMV